MLNFIIGRNTQFWPKSNFVSFACFPEFSWSKIRQVFLGHPMFVLKLINVLDASRDSKIFPQLHTL